MSSNCDLPSHMHALFTPVRKLYLDCPFEDKERCKLAGGQWDPIQKSWYILSNCRRELYLPWLPVHMLTEGDLSILENDTSLFEKCTSIVKTSVPLLRKYGTGLTFEQIYRLRMQDNEINVNTNGSSKTKSLLTKRI
jgi:hypothetical protein